MLRLKNLRRENEITEKTKAMFSMFHLGGYSTRYEPQPLGGSAITATKKIVADYKAQRTKALFDMFHIRL